MAKCVTRDKRILDPANGDYVQILVFFHWRKHHAQIDPAGPQRGNRFRRRCRDGADADLGIILMEPLQIREQEGMHDHIGGTDMDAPPVQMQHGLNLLFPDGNLLAGLRDVLVEHFPFRREPHSFVHPIKQRAAEYLFKLPYALAHRRLRKEQRLGRKGNAPEPRHVIKDLVVFKRDVHAHHPCSADSPCIDMQQPGKATLFDRLKEKRVFPPLPPSSSVRIKAAFPSAGFHGPQKRTLSSRNKQISPPLP